MLIRNIGAPRFVASANYDAQSDEVLTGETVEVSEEYGIEACKQVDVWEPADEVAQKKVTAAEKAEARERKQRDKEEAEVSVDDAPVADKAGE